MSTIDPREVLRRYGLRPRKGLGQNFLVDRSALERIVAAAELTSQDTLVEVGPGVGQLTQLLADAAGRVVAVELDAQMVQVLRQELAGRSNVEVVEGDILEVDVGALAGGRPYKVVANLPYYITSAALRHLLEAQPPPTLLVVTVQQEVAERITAQPGAMSLLAVSVQFYGRPRRVARIPAGAFYPPPKVDSAAVRIDVYPPAERPVQDVGPERFFRVARAGFGQRRKQLRNSLTAGLHLKGEQVAAALARAGIAPQRRAETLSLEEWAELSRALACVA
ncbi:MAG TPA: 16S rRNA (adenine(1518)-N(6)/adenine(1519)-N(6))-dimethyltransferase RsmA [Anaerolineae bacterium]|nr:16S rRNA (adenine(1518)-N(6)/adenine(1519)-N(6))-dimethyltransferase RsmA [Anaerolineae bacterium]HPL30021.1 16S rRNA (adenine(1518)-N(6)/adenine(1519)-N(6))-dimethyltransferase RsmA [Anaerolineae bacterium]